MDPFLLFGIIVSNLATGFVLTSLFFILIIIPRLKEQCAQEKYNLTKAFQTVHEEREAHLEDRVRSMVQHMLTAYYQDIANKRPMKQLPSDNPEEIIDFLLKHRALDELTAIKLQLLIKEPMKAMMTLTQEGIYANLQKASMRIFKEI